MVPPWKILDKPEGDHGMKRSYICNDGTEASFVRLGAFSRLDEGKNVTIDSLGRVTVDGVKWEVQWVTTSATSQARSAKIKKGGYKYTKLNGEVALDDRTAFKNPGLWDFYSHRWDPVRVVKNSDTKYCMKKFRVHAHCAVDAVTALLPQKFLTQPTLSPGRQLDV